MQSVNELMWYYRHRHWTLKDFAIIGCSFVMYIVLKITLPKIFKSTDERMLDKISWGIAIVSMIVLIFAT